MTAFKGVEVKAALMDLKIGFEIRHEVEKMAFIGDKTWIELISHLAKPFHARDARFFHMAEVEKPGLGFIEEHHLKASVGSTMVAIRQKGSAIILFILLCYSLKYVYIRNRSNRVNIISIYELGTNSNSGTHKTSDIH